jgi:hypothetical protein
VERDPVELDQLIEQLRASTATVQWTPDPPRPLRRPQIIDPVDGHPAIAYIHDYWTGEHVVTPGVGGRRSGWRRILYGFPRRAMLPERVLTSHLASLTEALAHRCVQLSAEMEDLRDQLDERSRDRAATDAELAQLLEAARREPGG